jgi:hypothetical protein
VEDLPRIPLIQEELLQFAQKIQCIARKFGKLKKDLDILQILKFDPR